MPSDSWLVHLNKCHLLTLVPLRYPSRPVKGTVSRMSNCSSVSREPRSGTSLLTFLQSWGGSMSCALGQSASQLLSHGIVNEMRKKSEECMWIHNVTFYICKPGNSDLWCNTSPSTVVHNVWSWEASTKSNGVNRDLVRNARLLPKLLNQKLRERSPGICVLTSPPGSPEAVQVWQTLDYPRGCYCEVLCDVFLCSFIHSNRVLSATYTRDPC